MKRRKTFRILVVSAFVLLLIACGMGCYLFFCDIPYKVTISKDTTYLTEPILEDGRVDYISALNSRFGQGVPVADNAMIPLLQIENLPFSSEPERRKKCCELLNIAEKLVMDSPNRPSYEWTESTISHYVSRLYGVASQRDLEKRLKESQAGIGANAQTSLDEYALTKDEIEAFSSLSESPEERCGLMNETLRTRFRRACCEPWSPNEWPIVGKWLKANDSALSTVVMAANRPSWYEPLIVGSEAPWRVRGPFTAELQLENLVIGLARRAMYRARLDDLDGAWKDVLAMKRMARHYASSWWWCTSTSGHPIEQASASPAFVVLAHPNLPEEKLRECLNDLAMLDPMRKMSDSLDKEERFFMLAEIDATPRYRAIDHRSSEYDSNFTPARRAGRNLIRLYVDWDEVLRRANGLFDEAVVIMSEPPRPVRVRRLDTLLRRNWLSSREFPNTNWDVISDPNPTDIMLRYHIGKIYPPRVIESAKEESAAIAAGRLTEIVGRLALYHRIHGEYPDSLEALLSDAGRGAGHPAHELLDDPFAETGRFRYVKTGTDEYLLYSLGKNGVDEAGFNDLHDHQVPHPARRDDIAVRIGPDGFVPYSTWHQALPNDPVGETTTIPKETAS